MFCTSCGNQLPGDAKFCPKCGKSCEKPANNANGAVSETPMEMVTTAEDVPPQVNENHPAGNFMWSEALAGPFIAWLCHRKEISKSSYSFFWPMLGWEILLNIPDRIVDRILDHVDNTAGVVLLSLLSIGWWIATIVITGKIAAARIKLCCPDYTKERYAPREKAGIIIGVVICVLVFIGAFCYGVLEAVAESM